MLNHSPDCSDPLSFKWTVEDTDGNAVPSRKETII
jgi:hypothetical protein